MRKALKVPAISIAAWELELLVGAGLSPYGALVAATRAPAEFVQDASFGTVAVGKRADLVLLNANPLADITASKNIAGVMVRGRWFPEWELTSMLDAMVARFSTDPVTCPN
jgi:imidazolonepropionase-like amidohydrolase